jgi:hypothetical protein
MNTVNESRLRQAYELYIELGTLEAAGGELGVTRERVRQLIRRGVEHGLFESPIGREPLSISPQSFLDLIAKHGSLSRVARHLAVAKGKLDSWRRESAVSNDDLRLALSRYRKSECLREYNELVERVGHHPTTTELEFRIPGARALYARIARHWPSFAAFRRELGIAPPAAGNPNIRRDTAAAHADRALLARMKREAAAAKVLDYLRAHSAATSDQLRLATGVGHISNDALLKAMERLGSVSVDRSRRPFLYSLNGE